MEVQDEAELCFPQLLNTSCKRLTSTWSEVVFQIILLSSFSLLTVALNLIVIISVSHFRQLHTPTNLLLLSLAVSDFLVGLLLMPGAVLPQTSCWFLGDLMCLLCNYVAFMINSSAIGNIVLISVDRYVAICDPLHYTTRITVRRVKLCVCLCWFFSALYSIFSVKNVLTQPGKYNSCQGECVVLIDYISGVVDLVLSFIVPVTIIIILYMRVFVVAVSQARAMRSRVAVVTLQVSLTLTSKKSELKAARTLGILVVVFLICLCPYYIAIFAGNNSLNTSSAFFVLYLFYLNSCLNPVIYTLFYPWFRKASKFIVTLQILQPDSCDANIL
ncbi:trace amine-associated receptor 13c-like [Thunnus albacares]|uniref:trace amine-associated receptor 13c-like n=1 Tax=Thunnus albacares TaxID=8236 RepID=UPI001CF63D4B|nr:trace amine-associated receptor 13c-like [Thunnus albacares]